ncbi:MAG: efflux RND transporter periplasmic adaptor subunit [Cytophagaceae bacterium]|nr:efflux RND transporter periplasmic adaptor subunit [Cytophagaceae bacterium]
MKTFHYISVAAASVVFLAACSSGTDLEKLKGELKVKKDSYIALKSEIDSLEAQVRKLEGDSGAQDAKKKLVSVQDVAIRPFAHYLEIQGKIEADKNVLISSKASGTILRINVNRGDQVRAGQVLAVIEDDLIVKGIAQLQTNLDLATIAYNKQKALWDQKIGSEIQFLQAKTNKESLEKQLAQLQEQQEMTRVVATVDGTIDDIYPKVGELAGPGAPICRIINTSNLKVRGDVAEGHISKVKKGNKVVLEFPDLNQTRESYITSIGDIINPASRSFVVEAKLPGNTNNLKANMITYLKIQDYSVARAFVAPLNVVQRDKAGTYLFVAENGVARRKAVKLGSIYKTDVEILEGLKEGDKIITVGYQDVVDGQNIKF